MKCALPAALALVFLISRATINAIPATTNNSTMITPITAPAITAELSLSCPVVVILGVIRVVEAKIETVGVKTV